MAVTSKDLGFLDQGQVLKHTYNFVDASLTTAGFLTGKVGRKIVQTISTTTSANDTQTFDFQESGISLYQLKVIYTDSSYATMISAERIS